MKFPKIVIHPWSNHGSEMALLGVIAVGVMTLMGLAQHTAKSPFDPSAYLVVVTMIVGAVKERWTQRSADQANANLAASSPPADPSTPTGKPGDPISVTPEE